MRGDSQDCFLPQLVRDRAKKYGSRTAIYYREDAIGKWLPISWTNFAQNINFVSNAFVKFGLSPQERIIVFAPNMPECMYSTLGGFKARVITLPCYTTNSAGQLKYIVDEVSARMIFVGEQAQYDTAYSIFSTSPSLQRLIIYDKTVKRNESDTSSIYFDEFLESGRSCAFQDEVDCRQDSIVGSDIACIVYSSGTTGLTKGVMITHQMLSFALQANAKTLPLTEKDVILNFLPFSHIFERAWFFLGLYVGCKQYINRDTSVILNSIKEVRPTCMCAVPRFWEKVYISIHEKVRKLPLVQRQIFELSMKIAYDYQLNYICKNITPSHMLSTLYHIAEEMVLKPIKKELGLQRAHFYPVAGSALSKDVEEFVRALGIDLYVGYGLTETTATVTCRSARTLHTPGSVGRLLEGMELKFTPQGEILVRGKNVTPGYFCNLKETKAAFDDDGWFYTRDIGYMKDNELYIVERLKEVYKTSNGKYIAPQQIEMRLVSDQYIDQVMVVADNLKFVSAIIVPDFSALAVYAKKHKITNLDNEALAQNSAINKLILSRIKVLQEDLAKYEQIKRIHLSAHPFSIENGELTSTLKKKRRVILEHYKAEIAAMYV